MLRLTNERLLPVISGTIYSCSNTNYITTNLLLIRKHMVSLRGSKFGSRVALLCCNPSHATRPGPGVAMQIGRFNNSNEDKYSGTNQSSGRFGRGHQWGPNYAPVH
jgi:hypothetical protein